MVRCVGILRGILHGQSNYFRERFANDVDEALGENLFACPLTMPKIQISDFGHGIDIGGDSRAKFPAFYSFERIRTVGIITPGKIRISDAQFGKNTVKH